MAFWRVAVSTGLWLPGPFLRPMMLGLRHFARYTAIAAHAGNRLDLLISNI